MAFLTATREAMACGGGEQGSERAEVRVRETERDKNSPQNYFFVDFLGKKTESIYQNRGKWQQRA
jgi:hypothetical protein